MKILSALASLLSPASVRSSFSPFELAAAGRLFGFGAFGFAILLVMTGRMTALFILLALSFAAQLAIGELSRCPGCGKRPTKFYLLDRETGIGQLLFRELWWPERCCSSCRTHLDGI